jgi:hypothetical protein
MSTPSLPTLDQAVSAVTAAEATYNADLATVANIETAIETATAPLSGAQATVATDTANYISALQTLDQVIQAKIASLQPSTPTS